MTASSHRLRFALIATAIVLAVAVPRLAFLDADPPPDAQFHFIVDEGLYAHNARQHALFGEWVMDDHNPPLYTAPLHTFVLRGVYEVFGVGLWQTRLPAAVGGLLTCFIVIAFVRREASTGTALLAGLLLAFSYFLVTNDRVGYTQPLQGAFVTLAVLAAVRSRVRPAWAALSAAGLIAALLCKVSSAPAAGVLAAVYTGLLIQARHSSEDRRRVLQAIGILVLSCVVILTMLWFWLIGPHWDAVREELMALGRLAVTRIPPVSPLSRAMWFGFRDERGAPPELNGFFSQEPVLVIGVAFLAAVRLLRNDQRPLGALEMACWLWIGILLAVMTTHSFAPDRRYILLVPPFAVLAGLAARAAHDAGQTRSLDRAGWPRIVAAWLVLGFAGGVYARALLKPVLQVVTDRIQLGQDPGLSGNVQMLMLWLTGFIVAALVVHAWSQRPLAVHPRRLGALIVGVALLAGLIRLGGHALQLRYTVRDTGHAIGALANALPPSRRVAAGTTAETLSLDHDMYCFVVRDWPHVGVAMNLDGVMRFRPEFIILTTRNGGLVAGPEDLSTEDRTVVARYDYWPDARGRPGLQTTVYAATDGLAQRAPGP